MSGTTVILLRSTDTGSPVLSGAAGSFIAFLDACLQDGYNSKSNPVFTRVGSTVTVTYATAHNYAADGLTKIEVSGCVETEYNGIFTPFNVTTLTWDYTITGTPDTPATGTRITKAAPLGWSKAFSGTNKAAYRSNILTGTRLYLRVDDNNPTADGNKHALCRGYETMTDVDNGTGLFPTVSQMTNGTFITKSSVSDSSARPWVLVGDGVTFYFFWAWSLSYPTSNEAFCFGDIKPEMDSDPYICMIAGPSAVYSSWPGQMTNFHALTSGLTTQSYHYLARNYTQVGGSVAFGKLGNSIGSTFGGSGMTYPAALNNGLYISPIYIVDGLFIRGLMCGIYQPLHLKPLGHGTLLPANQSPINRRLYSIGIGFGGANAYEAHFDIDGPWR